MHRVYCQMQVNQTRWTKKRAIQRPRRPLHVTVQPNEVWSLDFVHDRLYGGRPSRAPNLTDEADHGGLGTDTVTSIPASRAVRFVEQLIEIRGKLSAIRCHNGSELTIYALIGWCHAMALEFLFIQPGKSDQNAFIERFNRTYREEVVTPFLLNSIQSLRHITGDCLVRYKEIRPRRGGKPGASAVPRAAAHSGISTLKRST